MNPSRSLFLLKLMGQVENFFIYSVLPEIVGKWPTRKPIANEDGTVYRSLT